MPFFKLQNHNYWSCEYERQKNQNKQTNKKKKPQKNDNKNKKTETKKLIKTQTNPEFKNLT